MCGSLYSKQCIGPEDLRGCGIEVRWRNLLDSSGPFTLVAIEGDCLWRL